jgi:hypothetical protein
MLVQLGLNVSPGVLIQFACLSSDPSVYLVNANVIFSMVPVNANGDL